MSELDLDEIDRHARSYAADGDLEAQTLALTAELRLARRRIAETLVFIRDYEQVHAKEWPCLGGALRALTRDL